MGLFDRFRRHGPRRTGQGVTQKGLDELREFMRTRQGVEAFVEPPTAVYAMTLCLVAVDGEYRRQPVKDGKQARALCKEHGVPLYDARIVGYPKRMRDYERGIRGRGIALEDLPPLDVADRPRPDQQGD